MPSKRIFIFILLFITAQIISSQSKVVISDKEDYNSKKSAILELVTNQKGFLLPRMTTEDISNIYDPAETLIVFNIETRCIESFYYDSWHNFWCEPSPCEGYEEGVDYNGQNYSVIEMGTQCWFAENLNAGTMINGGNDQGTSCNDIEKYCYNNNEDNCNTFGGLYQWDQAMCGEITEGVRGICPYGWRIPTHDDWTTLELYVCELAGHDNCESEFPYDETADGYRGTDEGSRIAGSDLWNSGDLTDNPAFDENSDFYALPGGNQNYDLSADFYGINQYGHWWSSTEDIGDNSKAHRRYLNNYETRINRNPGLKVNGRSVRCVRSF